MAKGSRRSKASEIDQIFSIHTWRFNFAFELNGNGSYPPFNDDRKLNLYGELATPTNDKLSEIWVTAKHELTPSGALQTKTIAVGAYAAVQRTPVAILWMPADMVPAILQMVSTRRYRSVKLRKTFAEDGCPIVSRYSFSDDGPRIP